MAIDPAGLTPEPLEPVRGSRPDPRVVLWRDSATILVVVVLALLAWQTFAPGGNGGPAASGDIPSGVVVGSLPPGMSLPPGVTFGPIVPPSLDINATPTPIPVITLGPSPSPSPSPAPSTSPKPSKTPGTSGPPPTLPPPSDTPEPPPTDTPEPPTAPPADANFTWNEGLLCAVDFTNTSSGDSSWDWAFDDGGSSSSQNPSHLYLATGTYNVTLQINGSGGPSITKSVDVVGPCV